jgi:GT2 family glycosyltransferase
MKPIPVLGIPHYNRPDLLERCVESIDYPVSKLVIVQNGEDRDFPLAVLLKEDVAEKIIHIKHPNVGVAGSWNEIIMLFPSPWWMLVNNDIQFTPGDLEKMAKAAEANPDAGHIYGNHGASWFVVTEHCIRTISLFDFNLRPAYLEDSDHAYRCDLAGLKRITIPDCNAIHGEQVRGHMEGSRTVNATPQLQMENSRTHGNNFNYYRRKWGGVNEQETFKHPFNNPNLPLWAIQYDPDHAAQQQWRVAGS